MNLDPETCYWYRQQADKAIARMVESLRKDQPEEDTRMTRARIRAMEEVRQWKPESQKPDTEVEFL